ncbi:MAG: T9SS type A sorting domain-containing protein, partial [Bacteroidota bacterium]
LVVTDSLNCESQFEYVIEQPGQLVLDLNITDANGTELGSAGVNIQGGEMPYTILFYQGSDVVDNNQLEAGEYTVEVIDDNGCSVEAEFSIINLSINEIGATTITVGPNPVNSGAFQLNSTMTVSHIRVFNAVGEVIDVAAFNDSRTIDWDCSNWATGTYLLQVEHSNGEISMIKLNKIDDY